MSNISYNKAFTLVELIVVITILSVLATIAFISFQGYAATSRDSVRLTDMKNIQKVLNIFKENTGKYSEPDDYTHITFSGSIAWTQGVFGKNSYTDTVSMSNIPTDPLTLLPYAYSITNNGLEYQLATVLEQPSTNINNSQTYAGDEIAKIYIKGDYNGKFLKVNTGSLDYLLGVPSIIASDISSVDVMEIITNKRLVYKGYNNLPASYSGSIYDNNGGFAFEPNKVILFEGDINDFANDPATRLDFLDNLEVNYIGTEIATESSIAEILEIKSGSPSKADNYIANVLNNSLNTEITVIEISSLGISTDWRAQDPNCDIPDIVIGTQTWAGCNSTLGDGLEWGQLDSDIGTNNYNGTVGNCYDYNLKNTAICIKGDITMQSNTKANTWFNGVNINGDTEFNNIWGKLYIWDNIGSACGNGYHVPDNNEWGLLQNHLRVNNGGNYNIGWQGHALKSSTNNLVSALQLPLSGGYRFNQFQSRGLVADLWSSSPKTGFGNAYKIQLLWNYDIIFNSNDLPSYALSVRCIKD